MASRKNNLSRVLARAKHSLRDKERAKLLKRRQARVKAATVAQGIANVLNGK